LGTKAVLVLFVALILQCAFDDRSAQASSASPSQEDSVFCGSLNAAAVQIPILDQPSLHAAPGKAVRPVLVGCPLWSLAQSIDHPPERPV
jgi:hypothetical protein